MLVCAQTYAAIDEVLTKLAIWLPHGQLLHGLKVFRIHSPNVEPPAVAHVTDIKLKMPKSSNMSFEAADLIERLNNFKDSTLVFAPNKSTLCQSLLVQH
jgi:hypothetical protein